MNRRAFLSSLAAAAAGMTLDPERLLWRPGAKTIFLPSLKQQQLLIGWTTDNGGKLVAVIEDRDGKVRYAEPCFITFLEMPALSRTHNA